MLPTKVFMLGSALLLSTRAGRSAWGGLSVGKKASSFSLSGPFLWESLSPFHFIVCAHAPQLLILLLNSLIVQFELSEVQTLS